MNYTSSRATGTVNQFRTGTERSGRFKKIKPSLKPKPRRSLSLKPKLNPSRQAKSEAEIEPKPEPKVQPPPDAKIEPKTETKAKTPSDLTPQMVERVHALYEQLGREEVRAVEDLEKAESETRS